MYFLDVKIFINTIMNIYIACLAFEVIVLGCFLAGNCNYAWTKGPVKGGLWFYCRDHNDAKIEKNVPKTKIVTACFGYTVDAAEKYNHNFSEILFARQLMIGAVVTGAPVIIVASFGLCVTFSYGPYILVLTACIFQVVLFCT